MFLHLGGNIMVRKSSIVGIFDLDKTTVSKITREYLSAAEKGGRVVNVSFELPKSFIVCREGRKGDESSVVYISQLSSSTLKKRLASS